MDTLTTTQRPTDQRQASRPALALMTATVLAALIGMGVATGPAHADELVAADTSAAATTSVPGVISAPAVTAAASIPAGVVVSHHAGQPVSLYSKGQPTRHLSHPGSKPATFTHLAPGRLYTVVVGGVKVGSLTAIAKPTPATGLSVRTADAAGTVNLAWRHRPTIATGGRAMTYLVTATSPTATTLRSTVTGRPSATLTGLDGSALYTFTVVPRNTAGNGTGTRAVMTRSLDQLRGTSPVVKAATPAAAAEPLPAPAAAQAPTPTPAPAPGPAPKPATKTIYVCATGFTETVAGLCEKTAPYTYSTLVYTFHQEATGPAPLINSFETANVCPAGYNLEDYGWVKYCRLYGPAPTASVKDPAPAGYTDNGTAWTKKDAGPAGYTDDGTKWVSVVPKEAVVVPA